ncbi:methyltransferase [Amycolatopsis anabasis]|uniref:methyltransferase n=1 Tax=Amycolatopsis anabasis TaxID=1840409 RepID=UPI00131D29AB|nr:methyltransferase [Amycolatopsis anabasis]
MADKEYETGAAAADPGRLIAILHGTWKARALQVAAELGLADLLAGGPRTVEQLAEATGTHAPSLRRLLRALAGIGVFAERDGGALVANSPLSEWLRTDRAGSVAAQARFQGAPWNWRAWGALPHSVRTGETAFDQANGQSFWTLTGQDPAAAALFNGAMADVSLRESADVAAGFDFGGARTVVDVGGGLGCLLAAVLAANPGLTGTLFERPAAAEEARRWLDGQDLGGRFDVVSGDFFDAVPAGADLYLLKRTLHDWSDEDALRILNTVRRAMKPDSRILVIDSIPLPESSAVARFVDLLILVLVPGFDRTIEQYRELLGKAGFAVRRELDTRSSALRLIEAGLS